ncbi:hypothetical protein evm_009628 [Chilo suppressalis]|nr:hypothetical protein evm_009628 [Chilo suppressalis]
MKFLPPKRFVNSHEINGFSDRYVYEVVIPKENNYDQEGDNNVQDFVIIKSKVKTIDLGPYTLIRKLDEIKYMMLWLNAYCDGHPDCNKSKLNEELRKMLSSIVLQKTDQPLPNKDV